MPEFYPFPSLLLIGGYLVWALIDKVGKAKEEEEENIASSIELAAEPKAENYSYLSLLFCLSLYFFV